MAPKPATLPLPPLTHTDDKGSVWTFAPETGEWNVVVNGKKMSSKDSHVLRERVADTLKAHAQEKAKAGQAGKPIEVAMGRLLFSEDGKKFSIQPLVAKVEWNAAKGAPGILRYKGAKDDGWKSYDADKMVLVHPSYLTPEMKQAIEQALRIEHIKAGFKKAEMAIAAAWWDAKPEKSQMWAIHQGKMAPMPEGARKTSFSRSEGATISSGIPLISWQGDDVAQGWEAQADGSLRKQDISIRMSIDFSPKFSVFVDRAPDTIFESSNLSYALAIAKATMRMDASGHPAHHEWQHGGGDVVAHGRVSWPTRRTIYAQALLDQEAEQHRNNYIGSYFFGSLGGRAAGDGAAAEKDQIEAWREVNSYQSTSFRNAGPEDACLDEIEALRKQRDALIAKEHPKKIDAGAMAPIFQQTVADVYNAVGDGEELGKDMVAMGNMLDRIIERANQVIARDEAMTDWDKQCQKTCERALAMIANPPKPTKKSTQPR